MLQGQTEARQIIANNGDMNSAPAPFQTTPAAHKLIVFLHVPKTAGTTLNTIFRDIYGTPATCKVMMRGMSLVAPRWPWLPQQLISAGSLRRFQQRLRSDQGLRIVHGHFDMSLAKHLPADADYITLLRDPIERAISHYHHFRRRQQDNLHPLACQHSLSDWVSHCRLIEMDNGQTRRLAGASRLPIGQVDGQTFALAKANLRKFSLVGLSEQFADFQLLLQARYGWPCRRYDRQNVGRRPAGSELDQETLRTLISYNQWDIELYAYARSLFEQALSQIDLEAERTRLANAPLVSTPAAPRPGTLPAGETHLLEPRGFAA